MPNVTLYMLFQQLVKYFLEYNYVKSIMLYHFKSVCAEFVAYTHYMDNLKHQLELYIVLRVMFLPSETVKNWEAVFSIYDRISEWLKHKNSSSLQQIAVLRATCHSDGFLKIVLIPM